MVTQRDIAREVGIDVSSVNKILHHKPGSVFRKATTNRVFRAARKLGYRVALPRHGHRRVGVRRKVDLACELTLYTAGA